MNNTIVQMQKVIYKKRKEIQPQLPLIATDNQLSTMLIRAVHMSDKRHFVDIKTEIEINK